jgi:hypothetical protein
MPDMPTPEDLEYVLEEQEKQQRSGSLESADIPSAVESVVDAAGAVVELDAEAALEAGGTLLEGAVEVVGEVIGTVIGGIFD